MDENAKQLENYGKERTYINILSSGALSFGMYIDIFICYSKG